MQFTKTLLPFLLLLLHLSIKGQEYYLTLYAIPAPRPIDFSSPARLAFTATENALSFDFHTRKHPMGHVFIELGGPDQKIFTGSTKQRLLSSGREELINGYGLGILFRGIEGRLEFDGEITRYIDYHYRKGKIVFIKAAINEDLYNRLYFYLTEYQSRGYDTIYNGLNQPRAGLGAGCTAFGLSFFDVAGLLIPEWYEQWKIEVEVPHRLIGGPITGQHVPLTKVFRAKSWANENEPFEIFKIIDPLLIYNWVQVYWENIQDEHFSGMTDIPGIRAKQRSEAKGIFIDFEHAAVPDEPVFFNPPEEILPEKDSTQGDEISKHFH